jgi:hypothetical protein
MANKSEDHRVRDRRDRALREQQQQLGLEIERMVKASDDVLGNLYVPAEFAVLACALAEAIISRTAFPQVTAKAMCERLQKLIACSEED